jgi:hypothetical protein
LAKINEISVKIPFRAYLFLYPLADLQVVTEWVEMITKFALKSNFMDTDYKSALWGIKFLIQPPKNHFFMIIIVL